MRDDRIAGLRQMKDIFEYLYINDLLADALIEKKESCLLWQEVRKLFEKITIPDKELSEFIKTSIDYGVLLYNVIYAAWKVMAEGYTGIKSGNIDKEQLKICIREFDEEWAQYYKMKDNKYSSTLYIDEYLKMPGLGETIEYLREQIL